MGRTRDGLRRAEARNAFERSDPTPPLQAILSQLQDPPPPRVFGYRATEKRFRQDSQKDSSRTILGSRRASRRLGALAATFRQPRMLFCDDTVRRWKATCKQSVALPSSTEELL